MLASQLLATAMPGAVVTVVVQLAVDVTACNEQILVPVAVTVSVNGPQLTGTVVVPLYVELPPTASVIGPSNVLPSLSTPVTPLSGTLPVLETVPLTLIVVVP